MSGEKQLKEYYSQLALEGTLRSVIIGSSVGFFLAFTVFLIGALLATNLLWVGLGIAVVVSIATIILLYRLKFRPTMKHVAQRVDVLGFEERTITMVELQDDESFIAKIQRENATKELGRFSLRIFNPSILKRPLIILAAVVLLMGGSIGFMITEVNAAIDGPTDDQNLDDEIFQEMIDELLSIINNSNVNIELKNQLYTMVVDLEARLKTYDTYEEKYADVLRTRNEILQLIEDAIIEIEDSLINIAEALQRYENTETLGTALLTWDKDIISAAFDTMYDRIDDLLGQELYDVMNQTAIDIETALSESVGTDQAMYDALQQLADAYKIAIEDFQAGEEDAALDLFEPEMEASRAALLDAVQALLDLVEELLELEEEIEEEIERVDQFPLFIPFPADEGDGDMEGDPDTTSENTVIDGVTPYEEVYDSYYENAMDWLTSEEISEELRQIIENYFDMLQ